jgi:hypothetical protein
VVVSWKTTSITIWVPDNAPLNTLVPVVVGTSGGQATTSFMVTDWSGQGSSGSCTVSP